MLVVLCLATTVAFAVERDFHRETFQAYAAARSNYLAAPSNATSAWHFARACFDWAEFASKDTERARIANQGIDAARELIRLQPKVVEAHYYLGLNLGQLARTKSIGALRIVREMEHAFKNAAQLDSKFDYAGPDRSLGILYLEAPGWPASIGDKEKAREHLERTVALAPEYPDNQLSLMEAYKHWDDPDRLASAARKYRKILPEAKNKFSGDRWELAWRDWDKRWQKLQSALELPE